MPSQPKVESISEHLKDKLFYSFFFGRVFLFKEKGASESLLGHSVLFIFVRFQSSR